MTRDFLAGLKEEGRRLGFSDLGIVKPEATLHLPFYRDWISRGLHGEMGYLAREDSVARRGDLRLTMAEVQSVVVVAQEYFQEDPPGVPRDPSLAVIARYARGHDYHDVLKARLKELLEWLKSEARAQRLADDVRGLPYVDTGPILERDLANRAGLGWFGKNTFLIHPRRGSYSFIGLLLLDLELPPSPPFEADRCGSCTACLEACPTGALLGRDENGAPVMDARRCISYLTIELKGPIPRELRSQIGNRIFGCDICQEVCPFARKFSSVTESSRQYAARPDLNGAPLIAITSRILSMSAKGYLREFADSPISRPRRTGMLRNLCVALGNWGDESAVSTLGEALTDASPLVRAHAAWALGEIGSETAFELLGDRVECEPDPLVLEELGDVLSRVDSSET